MLGNGSPVAVGATLGAIAIGALLPDLDHPRAYLAQLRLARSGLFSVVRPFGLPASVLHSQFGHRGGMHSLLAVVVIVVGLNAVGTEAGIHGLGYAIGWGYALHLLADMLTIRGVPLFWPVSSDNVGTPSPLSVRTGSLGESLLLCAILALTAAYAFLLPR